jgi:hypothetical protein
MQTCGILDAFRRVRFWFEFQIQPETAEKCASDSSNTLSPSFNQIQLVQQLFIVRYTSAVNLSQAKKQHPLPLLSDSAALAQIILVGMKYCAIQPQVVLEFIIFYHLLAIVVCFFLLLAERRETFSRDSAMNYLKWGSEHVKFLFENVLI